MYYLYEFFSCLVFLCCIMMSVSLISPRWGTFKQRPGWSRKRACASYFVLVIIFAALSGCTIPDDIRIANEQAAEQRKEQEAIAEKKKNDILCHKFKLTLDQAQAVESALDEVGIGKIKDAKKDKFCIVLDAKAKDSDYTIDDYETRVFLDNDNNLQTIKLETITLYDNGHVVHKINDFLLSTTEQVAAESNSRQIVNQLLKAPSTAEFNGFKHNKKDGIITTTGYVDAQNSFGAMLRTPFQIQYDTNNNMKPIHFLLGDKNLF